MGTVLKEVVVEEEEEEEEGIRAPTVVLQCAEGEKERVESGLALIALHRAVMMTLVCIIMYNTCTCKCMILHEDRCLHYACTCHITHVTHHMSHERLYLVFHTQRLYVLLLCSTQ